MSEFGSLESQDVREHWRHEENDFTPWLADEIEAEVPSHLENALGLDLEVVKREKSVGKYNVDIFAKVVDDRRNVVIENQLNSSDHDHLGKSLAYAAGVDADIIVWVAPSFNDEHIDALRWLNENSREGVDLFAIKLEVWRIGESDPAVRLNPVEKPSEWKEKVKRSSTELTETKKLQEEFWTAFRDKIRTEDTPLRARKAYPQHWYNNPVGKAGFKISFTINTVEDRIYTRLIINNDPEVYWKLEDERSDIDAEFEETLSWDEPEETHGGNERSKIKISRPAQLTNKDEWDEYLNWLIEQGKQFHEVFGPRIQDLD